MLLQMDTFFLCHQNGIENRKIPTKATATEQKPIKKSTALSSELVKGIYELIIIRHFANEHERSRYSQKVFLFFAYCLVLFIFRHSLLYLAFTLAITRLCAHFRNKTTLINFWQNHNEIVCMCVLARIHEFSWKNFVYQWVAFFSSCHCYRYCCCCWPSLSAWT